jgi:hypothetical protein
LDEVEENLLFFIIIGNYLMTQFPPFLWEKRKKLDEVEENLLFFIIIGNYLMTQICEMLTT